MSESIGGLVVTAVTMLIAGAPYLTDAQRKVLTKLHHSWQQKTYGTNEYVQYKDELYVSLLSVPATAPAPDQPASPANWKKLL